MAGSAGRIPGEQVPGEQVPEEQVAALVGHRFPGGRVRLDADVDRRLREVIGARPGSPGGPAHPLTAFLVAQDGLGTGLGEVFALFGAAAADGPMLGEWSMRVSRPLRVGAEYDVRAEVAAVERKQARSGVFDLATTVAEILGADGEVDVEVRSSLVFPRRAR